MPPTDHHYLPGIRLAVAAVVGMALLVPYALLMILVVGNAGALHAIDVGISRRLNVFAVDHPGWVTAMSWWSLVFHPNTWRVATLVLAGWLLVRRHARRAAAWVAVTMATGGVLGVVLKLLVGRDRPEVLEPVARAAGYSFPSGHAFTNALGATVLVLVLLPLVRRRAARIAWCCAAVVVPLVTGLTRIGLGVHYLSDVTAGWLLGVALPAITALALYRLRRDGAPRGREAQVFPAA